MKQKATGIDDLVEALDLYSSSFDMDVFASLKIIRQPNGIVHYIRDSYVAQEAKEDSGQIFWGLHRVPHDVSAADIATLRVSGPR